MSDTDTLSERLIREIIEGCEGAQGGPWKLDKFACYVWAPSEKGGDFPLMDELGGNERVAEMRGWGYYTGNGHGALALSPAEAKNRQRMTGEHIARLDPATVRSAFTELLANRAALSAAQARIERLETALRVAQERFDQIECAGFANSRQSVADILYYVRGLAVDGSTAARQAQEPTS